MFSVENKYTLACEEAIRGGGGGGGGGGGREGGRGETWEVFFSSPPLQGCPRELACRLLTPLFCVPFQGSSLCGVSLLSNSHRLCRRKGWTLNFIIGFSLFVCFNPAQRPFKLPR